MSSTAILWIGYGIIAGVFALALLILKKLNPLLQKFAPVRKAKAASSAKEVGLAAALMSVLGLSR